MMGYPMTYRRVIARNRLTGGYATTDAEAHENIPRSPIAGDLRRLEKDQRDDDHLTAYATQVGITRKQAKQFLDLFFGDEELKW